MPAVWHEKLGPARTFDWIKDVLGELSECVTKRDGVLVDYIGDELMAMWGAPEHQPDHAVRAAAGADLIAPANMETRDFHVGGRPRRVYEYVGPGAGGRRIWGATALILHNLAQRLEHIRLEQG